MAQNRRSGWNGGFDSHPPVTFLLEAGREDEFRALLADFAETLSAYSIIEHEGAYTIID